ncbi:hypothetical protein [Cytobacillus sp. FSL K6-0265]|uniref:hypothetical protein n=1 Tax=Cytobacillus sp. FSL K6-0265 TaxID=2921448 RepID=UPI0030FC6550
MKYKKTKVIISIMLVSVVCVMLFNFFKKDIWDVNADLLKEEVLSIESSIEEVNLLDITPFDWDKVYFFGPYTPKEWIYETVGYKWDTISETVNEGMNQIVFLKNDQVVCYVYGYPENTGYGISMSENASQIPAGFVLKADEQRPFEVAWDDDVVYLKSK